MANKQTQTKPPMMEILSNIDSHTFQTPTKRINEGGDVSFFLSSKAYSDIMKFVLQLNLSMFPSKDDAPIAGHPAVISQLQSLLQDFEKAIDEAPPDPGPRRFGNIAFKQWYALVEGRAEGKLASLTPTLPAAAIPEIQAYLLGGFGSAQRLDYGTGHELSFLAFLACLWKLNCFPDAESITIGRLIVKDVFDSYLNLMRRLILTYNLEPAGSHGVWGLDDHSFLPYIFGSAQLSPRLGSSFQIPLEGSAPDAPDPGDITRAAVVERERHENLYFGAIGFINDVKKGPFWEHSPVLYDISGVQAGWAKINKGMIKMYNAEVLSKFPVVQHFPFGSLFLWETDPNAIAPNVSAHVSSQPTMAPKISRAQGSTTPSSSIPGATAAPWATTQATRQPGGPPERGLPPRTRAPRPAVPQQPPSAGPPNPGTAPTRAPWAKE